MDNNLFRVTVEAPDGRVARFEGLNVFLSMSKAAPLFGDGMVSMSACGCVAGHFGRADAIRILDCMYRQFGKGMVDSAVDAVRDPRNVLVAIEDLKRSEPDEAP